MGLWLRVSEEAVAPCTGSLQSLRGHRKKGHLTLLTLLLELGVYLWDRSHKLCFP